MAHRSPRLGFMISLLSSLLLQLNISVYLFVSCCVHEQYEHWLCLCPFAPCHCLSPSVSMLALKWEQMPPSSCLLSWYQCL